MIPGASATPLELEELLKEISWSVRLKLLNEMSSSSTPKPVLRSPTDPTPDTVSVARLPARRVGIESLVQRLDEGSAKRRQIEDPIYPPHAVVPDEVSADENNMRLKLFRLMYETVRDSDLKVKRAELIQEHYSNKTSFQIGYLMGDVTDKFSIMTDISTTLERFYGEWKPIEHINAYEQIANQAIEISHLIDLMRTAHKRDAAAGGRDKTRRF